MSVLVILQFFYEVIKGMINSSSLKAVAGATFSSSFRRPLYDSYCFSRIAHTGQYLLSGEGKERALPKDCFLSEELYDMVIVFVIDGFGWRFFEENKDHFPFLQKCESEGIVSKITSQFPSTTAAHITNIHTGLTPSQSGVYEWFYYEPFVDQMIAPLLYSYAGDKVSSTLERDKISPTDLFPARTIYQDMKKQGIESFVMQQENIASSPYSEALSKGAHHLSYMQWEQGLQTLREAVLSPKGSHPSYFFTYFGDIDAAGHRTGIGSPEFIRAIHHCFESLEKHFLPAARCTHKKVACLITADHGMVDVDPKKTFYLNEVYPQIFEHLQTNRQGKYKVPAGSCRDFFLHIKENHIDTVVADLKTLFHGKAEVFPVSELIEQKLFGAEVSSVFLSKVGNVVILPYEKEAIWWKEKNRFEQHFYAAHGGLTPAEMESIFLFLPL